MQFDADLVLLAADALDDLAFQRQALTDVEAPSRRAMGREVAVDHDRRGRASHQTHAAIPGRR